MKHRLCHSFLIQYRPAPRRIGRRTDRSLRTDKSQLCLLPHRLPVFCGLFRLLLQHKSKRQRLYEFQRIGRRRMELHDIVSLLADLQLSEKGGGRGIARRKGRRCRINLPASAIFSIGGKRLPGSFFRRLSGDQILCLQNQHAVSSLTGKCRSFLSCRHRNVNDGLVTSRKLQNSAHLLRPVRNVLPKHRKRNSCKLTG